jgi:hypothetical protein
MFVRLRWGKVEVGRAHDSDIRALGVSLGAGGVGEGRTVVSQDSSVCGGSMIGAEMKIKLRRGFEGQDSWGAYIEEVGIDDQGNLAYRRSDGGNCHWGNYKDWEPESKAIEFLLGPLPNTPLLRNVLVSAIAQLPDLEPATEGRGGVLQNGIINFGEY